jgi:hypothetical protein
MPTLSLVGLMVVFIAGCHARRLPKATYVDKCQGAWAGQMIGVCYGAPYEFKSNGKPITTPLHPWRPSRVADAVNQDDCYVEMTFLTALAQHGPDITPTQAGAAFGRSEYPLWHANRAARENIRRGIMPPLSGHPRHNRHADDIDFQIESDLIGIVCPGLPRESNRLCDIFGHIMNYGDGVYGGMFVAGMYTAAYFEDRDVERVLREGLACIPAASQYHQCISDVLRWHRAHPEDWLTTWRKIEAEWQDDVDCLPGDPFNIDAKLNGAYIAMGLLYGGGDPERTMEIATRCGQDTDCNASNALGVLGCMVGYEALGERLTGGIPGIAQQRFAHTAYTFEILIPACQQVAEQMIRRAGGTITADAYLIPRQSPRAPIELEQWTDQRTLLATAIPAGDVEMWDNAWRVAACGHHMEPGLRSVHNGRTNVLMLHPVSRTSPALLTAELAIPLTAHPRLQIDMASHERGDSLLKLVVDRQTVLEALIDTNGNWRTEWVDLTSYAGRRCAIRLELHANDWDHEAVYIDRIAIRP